MPRNTSSHKWNGKIVSNADSLQGVGNHSACDRDSEWTSENLVSSFLDIWLQASDTITLVLLEFNA